MSAQEIQPFGEKCQSRSFPGRLPAADKFAAKEAAEPSPRFLRWTSKGAVPHQKAVGEIYVAFSLWFRGKDCKPLALNPLSFITGSLYSLRKQPAFAG